MSGNSPDGSRRSGARSGSEGAPPANGAERGATARGEDVALVCGLTDDGQGVQILRKRGERLEAGTVRKLEPGKPIHGEVVRLRPRPRAPLLCDVEVEFDATMAGARGEEPALAVSSGPPQVATDSYRKNWDAVYGNRKASLLN